MSCSQKILFFGLEEKYFSPLRGHIHYTGYYYSVVTKISFFLQKVPEGKCQMYLFVLTTYFLSSKNRWSISGIPIWGRLKTSWDTFPKQNKSLILCWNDVYPRGQNVPRSFWSEKLCLWVLWALFVCASVRPSASLMCVCATSCWSIV